MLTDADIAELVALRRDLHRMPDVSGDEAATADRIAAELAPLAPGHLVRGLGGHGLAAIWTGAEPGPTVLFRAELDGLPILDLAELPHRSQTEGKGHLCGHDGHMAILLALARLIHRRPPAQGRVILLFQPAEETGAGAAAVVADPRWTSLAPDWAFALHNWPGLPFGTARLAPGTVNCASEGLALTLTGRTSHAAEPGAGRSPGALMAALMLALPGFSAGSVATGDLRLITLTHARLGAPTFGISPGEAQVFVTLRTQTDAEMARLRAAVLTMAQTMAASHGLHLAVTTQDAFAASVNHPQAVDRLSAALGALGIAADPSGLPFLASEDFGRISGHGTTRGAMVFLGAGDTVAPLHAPTYDFPDDLIPVGARIFDRLLRDLTD